ncbi:hypothetical protein ACQ86D_30190 [Streptomyces galilaeus]
MANRIVRTVSGLRALFRSRGRHRAGQPLPPTPRLYFQPTTTRHPGPYVTATHLNGHATP